MNTEESVAWFRAKNARRKQEQQTLSSKELHRRRTERRNMPNGAFGNTAKAKQEETDDNETNALS
jgi:hypothetical protein